jgi:hypothetical protein
MRLLVFTAALLSLAGFSGAVPVDRIAATVGNRAITETEISREIKLTALESGTQPKFDLPTRQAAVQRLVEQALIRREMEFGGYPSASDEEVNSSFEQTVRERGGEVAIKRELAELGLTMDDLKAHLRWQIELLKFIDLRFRPAVQVTPEDVEKYYNDFAGKQPNKPPLSQMRAQIEQKLTGERVDQQMNRWFGFARRRSPVTYVDKSLTPPATKPENAPQQPAPPE